MKTQSIAILAAVVFGVMALSFSCEKRPQPTPDPENKDTLVVGPGGGSSSDTTHTHKPESNISGRVVDEKGNPIAGVLVSDGLNVTSSRKDGTWYLMSDLEKTRFVFVSTPSEYRAEVVGGRPIFYKELSKIVKKGGVYENVDFKLYSIPDPASYSVFFSADPQPRKRTAGFDKIAYHSLDNCEDMFRDMRETAAKITDRPVYGIVLGDIVHEIMDLFEGYYLPGLASLPYATFSVMGNHDNNTKAVDDESAANDFETHLGPRDYSFNLGGIHYIVLDDIIMQDNPAGVSSYKTGLTEKTWTWLQNDLANIPFESTLMVCTHSPLFMLENGTDRSSSSNVPHGADYRKLFAKYKKVYAWAGHIHSTFNYAGNYPGSSPVIESHTVTRTTGELWTNEYLGANGTPRGYVIMDVIDGRISWKFHPIPYQSSAYSGSAKPFYEYREWTYDASGVAMIGGKKLDESYQMRVYAPGSYGDDYVYVNVFLWDEMWEKPVLVQGSSTQEMARVTSSSTTMFDRGLKELRSFYVANSQKLVDGGYKDNTTCPSLFRVKSASPSKEGTVKVKDRFGNEYECTISW